MYEDDPQELIFDVLGETIFADDPLGRATLGRADVVGAATREQLLDFHRERYFAANIVIAAAGSVEHERVVELGRRRAGGRRCGRAGPTTACVPRQRRRRPAAAPASLARTPSSTTLTRRRPGSAATTSAASRCACSKRSSAAPPPRACSRRCASAAAWPTRSSASRASTRDTGQIGLYVGTRAGEPRRGSARSLAASSSGSARSRRAREELERAQGEPEGAHRARARVDRRAHGPARLLGAGRDADALGRRDVERIDAVDVETVARAGRRAARPRAALARRRSAPTRRPSARAARAAGGRRCRVTAQ